MKIWLDDIRPAPDGWVWCKSVQEFADIMDDFGNRARVEAISFDHDLGDGVPTGYDAVKALEAAAAEGVWSMIPSVLTVHSANPVGRKNIQAAIDSIERKRNGE